MYKLLTILSVFILFSCQNIKKELNNGDQDIIYTLDTPKTNCQEMIVNLDKLTIQNCDELLEFKSLRRLCNYLNKVKIIDFTVNQELYTDIELEFADFLEEKILENIK